MRHDGGIPAGGVRARADLSRMLTATCVVRRATRTLDSEGGYTEAIVDVATVACFVEGASAEEPLGTSREDMVERVTISLPSGTDVRPDDRLVSGGATYQVIAISESSGVALTQVTAARTR